MILTRNRSLYIQALTAWQNMEENDQLSYFQVAGIHGLPFIPWNNASDVADWQWGGYCTHGMCYLDLLAEYPSAQPTNNKPRFRPLPYMAPAVSCSRRSKSARDVTNICWHEIQATHRWSCTANCSGLQLVHLPGCCKQPPDSLLGLGLYIYDARCGQPAICSDYYAFGGTDSFKSFVPVSPPLLDVQISFQTASCLFPKIYRYSLPFYVFQIIYLYLAEKAPLLHPSFDFAPTPADFKSFRGLQYDAQTPIFLWTYLFRILPRRFERRRLKS